MIGLIRNRPKIAFCIGKLFYSASEVIKKAKQYQKRWVTGDQYTPMWKVEFCMLKRVKGEEGNFVTDYKVTYFHF